ncbi:MAG TPA: hypothetical protein VLT51_12425 [Anaerolineales bacterium]|nr:hypothetical protein [Anaerolineales bacterium]
MKHLFIVTLITTIALVISACGGTPAEPTISAQDIQSTAVAAAFTIVAQTQAAIPTSTPIPPTETPVPSPTPTETLVPSPTLEAALIPTFTPIPATSSNNTGGDPCNKPLAADVTGHPTKIRLSNETKGTLVISLYLNKTPFGECGYRGYNLGPNDSTTITDLPQGCYNVSVFVTEPNKSSKSFGYGCINNTDLWEFKIYADKTVLLSP